MSQPHPSQVASPPAAAGFTRYQRTVVGLLAFLQFAVILDFMLMSPLGAMIMPAMQITPQQFGLVVSAYAFSAGASGLLTAGFADRFDRKRLLLFFYSGFVIGTLWCGLAQSFESLLLARIVTGLFGGQLFKGPRWERMGVFVGLWVPTFLLLGKIMEDRERMRGER